MNEAIRNNPEQFIGNDIIDKVLLKDLPSLYGIHEIPELNKLFAFLAYNAGNEASLENISQESGITKPTIRRYIEYLESAFLIIKVSNVDDNCRTMKRERNFKVYLNNPSMRAALFAPVRPDDADRIGHLTESAIFSQWQHAPNFRNLRYARWRNEGEVDIVYLAGHRQTPYWIGEIKWSDGIEISFSRRNAGNAGAIEAPQVNRVRILYDEKCAKRDDVGRPVALRSLRAPCIVTLLAEISRRASRLLSESKSCKKLPPDDRIFAGPIGRTSCHSSFISPSSPRPSS